ncbi:MAG: hypothetical protein J6P64_08980 [Bacteroidales bacterium]|nr:hypothetical protein [Bacteroidales bacterium]
MYQIVKDMTTTVNGLGAGGETFANVMQALTPVVQAGQQIAQTVITAKNQGAGTAYTPTVYTPTAYTPATAEKKTDWTPWIIGGAIAVAGLYLMIKK